MVPPKGESLKKQWRNLYVQVIMKIVALLLPFASVWQHSQVA